MVPEENVEPDPLADYESIAFERIKDQVNRLGWEGMQQLIAGILRAMGYKTQVSPPGSDLGRDILASPDGFGFERPRIVVEVKHRKQTMGSTDIRSFLGGRHPDDRGLYVSTGGFTKDARYEADRSTVPLALWTLDEVTKALLDNYESTDTKTRSLISLRTFYGPVAD
ncbi:restriction endonuclease [Mycolicibacter sinensis]|uniref:Restriction endonuclease n=1 Tax=Mycolicibacter sinensis (strain JDM601) TaxID=875328 RepID=F5Z2I3_MYCSD|nr:restriction endonuclease [Mycolicibacter sinensis]